MSNVVFDLKETIRRKFLSDDDIIIFKKMYVDNENIFTQNDKDTLLIVATKYNHFEIIKFMVENGARIATHGNFALLFSCQKGYIDTIRYLLSVGGDINCKNGHLLIIACEYQHLNIIKYLLTENTNTYINEACIYWTIKNNNYEILKILIDNGASITNASFFATVANDNIKMFKTLMEFGGDVDNSEILKESVNKCSINILKYVLNMNLDVEITEDLLSLAVKKGRLDVFNVL